MKAIFLNHQQQRCGVYQMGRRIGRTLQDAGLVTYMEVVDQRIAEGALSSLRPRAVIYNWHPATLPWAPTLARRFPAIKHVALMHEISPENPGADRELFAHRVVCDPSFAADGVSLFRTIRHVPRFDAPERTQGEPLTIGSFGFAVGGKLFPMLVGAVADEFPGARVRLRIPSAHYGDDAGHLARQLADASRSSTKQAVTVEVEHDFLGEDELVRWLSGNDLNVFFYDYNPGRGISSTVDYAIAAQRPISVNGSQMFRHVPELGVYPQRSLREALSTNGPVVRGLYETWSTDRMVQDYAAILAALG